MLNIRPFNLTQKKAKRKAVDRKYSLRNITKNFFLLEEEKKL